MTKASRRHARQQQKIRAALTSVNNGTSFRVAARSCHLPTTTFYRQYKMQNTEPVPAGRPPALLPDEENVIVETLLKFAARGFPLNRERLLDAVSLFCAKLPEDRRDKLPFTDGWHGLAFASNFAKRHKLRVKFGKPSAQEGKRFSCTNAVNLVSYAAALESIIRENGIDERRIANIDETGFSPDRDALGRTQNKRYGLRGVPIQTKLVTFSYRNRNTLLPVVFASGHSGRPLWIFKGKTIPYRTVIDNGSVTIETLSDCLIKDSNIVTRKETAGVDKDIFVEWAELFVEDVRTLTAGGRKVLLLYHAYRSHMSLDSLEILEQGGVIAFALPAHTSCTMQPLDVGLFQPFKQNVNRVIDDVAPVSGEKNLDIYDLCRVLSRAYDESFIPTIIRGSFEKAGIHPFNSMKYLSVPRPLSADSPETIVSVPELEEMLKKKQEERRNGLGIQKVVMKRGFVDTSAGLS